MLRVGGRQVIVKMIDIYTDFHEPPPLHRCCAAHQAVTMCSYLIDFLAKEGTHSLILFFIFNNDNDEVQLGLCTCNTDRQTTLNN